MEDVCIHNNMIEIGGSRTFIKEHSKSHFKQVADNMLAIRASQPILLPSTAILANRSPEKPKQGKEKGKLYTVIIEKEVLYCVTFIPSWQIK